MIQQNKSLMENEKHIFSLGLFKVLLSIHCLKSLKDSFVNFLKCEGEFIKSLPLIRFQDS